MRRFIQQWIKISLISLLAVAFLGCVLRYKIAFSLTFVNQKYLLHAHSHFAFAGWITQALMACLIGYQAKASGQKPQNKYRALLVANLVTAYGMLFSFTFEGYGLYSIVFSTLSIFVTWIFAVVYWRDLNRLPGASLAHRWLKMAVLLNAVSSLGAFTLAYMMATKNMHQEWYMAAVYLFLHFQYNGWFFFSCMGLLTAYLLRMGINKKRLRLIFLLFAFSCIPAYFLSILWLQLPAWLYWPVVLAVSAQMGGFVLLITAIRPVSGEILKTLPRITVYLAACSGIALLVKLLLQLLSAIPYLNQLVFGFRPIVIGYLHLVFLGIVTLFIMGYCIARRYIIIGRRTVKGIIIFTLGIIINELLLMLQGIAALFYISVPYINEWLLGAALCMFTGVLVTLQSQFRLKQSPLLLQQHYLAN